MDNVFDGSEEEHSRMWLARPKWHSLVDGSNKLTSQPELGIRESHKSGQPKTLETSILMVLVLLASVPIVLGIAALLVDMLLVLPLST